MKHFYFLIATFITTTIACQAQNNTVPASLQRPTNGIEWLSFEEAVKRNETQPKMIFIDFYTDWCGWCKYMDKNTFQDTAVARLMNKYFYSVKFNAERKDTVHFKGKDYVFIADGARGYHELAAAIMNGQMSYPTFMFLTDKYEIITPVQGFVKTEEFLPILEFVGQQYYLPEKGMSWEQFRASYQK